MLRAERHHRDGEEEAPDSGQVVHETLLEALDYARNAARGLPFAGEQSFVTPVPFHELSVLDSGVTATIVEFEAHLTLLIYQLQTRLRPIAYVTVAEFERRDLVGMTMNMVVTARSLNYAFRAVVTHLKLADDVRRYPARSRRCDKFSEFADVID